MISDTPVAPAAGPLRQRGFSAEAGLTLCHSSESVRYRGVSLATVTTGVGSI